MSLTVHAGHAEETANASSDQQSSYLTLAEREVRSSVIPHVYAADDGCDAHPYKENLGHGQHPHLDIHGRILEHTCKGSMPSPFVSSSLAVAFMMAPKN